MFLPSKLTQKSGSVLKMNLTYWYWFEGEKLSNSRVNTTDLHICAFWSVWVGLVVGGWGGVGEMLHLLQVNQLNQYVKCYPSNIKLSMHT